MKFTLALLSLRDFNNLSDMFLDPAGQISGALLRRFAAPRFGPTISQSTLQIFCRPVDVSLGGRFARNNAKIPRAFIVRVTMYFAPARPRAHMSRASKDDDTKTGFLSITRSMDESGLANFGQKCGSQWPERRAAFTC